MKTNLQINKHLQQSARQYLLNIQYQHKQQQNNPQKDFLNLTKHIKFNTIQNKNHNNHNNHKNLNNFNSLNTNIKVNNNQSLSQSDVHNKNNDNLELYFINQQLFNKNKIKYRNNNKEYLYNTGKHKNYSQKQLKSIWTIIRKDINQNQNDPTQHNINNINNSNPTITNPPHANNLYIMNSSHSHKPSMSLMHTRSNLLTPRQPLPSIYSTFQTHPHNNNKHSIIQRKQKNYQNYYNNLIKNRQFSSSSNNKNKNNNSININTNIKLDSIVKLREQLKMYQ